MLLDQNSTEILGSRYLWKMPGSKMKWASSNQLFSGSYKVLWTACRTKDKRIKVEYPNRPNRRKINPYRRFLLKKHILNIVFDLWAFIDMIVSPKHQDEFLGNISSFGSFHCMLRGNHPHFYVVVLRLAGLHHPGWQRLHLRRCLALRSGWEGSISAPQIPNYHKYCLTPLFWYPLQMARFHHFPPFPEFLDGNKGCSGLWSLQRAHNVWKFALGPHFHLVHLH